MTDKPDKPGNGLLMAAIISSCTADILVPEKNQDILVRMQVCYHNNASAVFQGA
jgi:hypothetical protein